MNLTGTELRHNFAGVSSETAPCSAPDSGNLPLPVPPEMCASCRAMFSVDFPGSFLFDPRCSAQNTAYIQYAQTRENDSPDSIRKAK